MVNYLNKSINKIYSIFFISALVFFYYSFFYLDLNIPNSLKDIYLVLSYADDPVYLKILYSLNDFNSTPEGKTIVLYFIENIISNTIGFKYIWLSMPIIKSLSISFIFLALKKSYNLNSFQQLILLVFLFFIFFTNNITFQDRFSRPHIVQLIVPISYFLFMKYEANRNNLLLFFSVAILTLLVLADPWLVAFFLVFYFTFSFFKKNFKANALIVLSFFLTITIIYFITSNVDEDFNFSLQYEYLGYKEIYSSTNFIYDYLKAIISDRYILVSLFLISFTCSLNKTTYSLICIYLAIIFGWLPYIIIDSTVQAYHIIFAVKSFLTYLIIFEIGLIISKIKVKTSFNQIIYSFLILTTITINFHTVKSPPFKLANKLFKNYNLIFNDIKSLNRNCEIVSNDAYVRMYSLTFTKNKLSVSEGFYNPLDLETIMNAIDRSMLFLKENFKNKNNEELNFIRKKFIHLATHNYFSISNSLIAPSLKSIKHNFNNHDFKSTFTAWNLVYPDSSFAYKKSEFERIGPAYVVLRQDYDYFLEKPNSINMCD